ncbi:MAG: hypothetical protein ACYCPT_13685, partial [Acidimicrobiales bacterium]
TTTTPTVVTLPKWTDAASVTSYLTSFFGVALAVVTAIHPGYTEPTIIQALLPSVGAVIAAAAQIFNLVTHRSAQKAALAAHATIVASGYSEG